MSTTDNKNNDGKKPDAFRKTSAWARPRAMARDSNVSAWLALAGIICLCLALWTPIAHVFWGIRNRNVDHNESLPRNANCFLAISYEGISPVPDPSGRFIFAQDFRAHIAALKNAGYHAIGLEDVRAFYEDHRPLPPKAILLTFENTRKNTFFEGRAILEDLNWRAVMGVITRRVNSKDRDTILWPYLKSMAMDDRWDLACESSNGVGFIAADSQGLRAPFFATRKWLFNESRFESVDEFKERIDADHAAAIRDFESKLHQKPIAFFFPLGNYGQFEQGGRTLRDANLDSVSKFYKLGFILNNQALNEATTDHRRLNRMSIPPSMTPEALVATLNNAWPFESADGFGVKPVNISRWNADWGLIEKETDAFTLRASHASDQRLSDYGSSTGARAWLAGSSQFTDGTFDCNFELIRGEFHAYFRYQSDDSWVKVALDESGRITVGQAIPGSEPEILANAAINSETDFRSSHNLFVTIRRDTVYVRFDGKSLFGGPVRLRTPYGDSVEPGLIGISIQASEPGLAQSHIRETYIRPNLNGVISWPATMSRNATHVMRELTETMFRYSVIAPPWLDVFASSQLSYPDIDSASLRVIADANKSRIFPAITLHAEAAFPNSTKSDIVNQLVDTNADGILIDASDFPADRLPLLKTWIDELDVLLAARKLALAVRFPASKARLDSLSESYPTSNDRLFVDDGNGHPPSVSPEHVLHFVSLPPPPESEENTRTFQISSFDEAETDALPQNESLRRKGYKAYSEGDYASATNFWNQWCSSEPGNAEAWMLYGHALARLPDPEAAVRAYGHSLRLNPGQIDLMVECARLYDTNGKSEKAEEMLDTYARAFPDDPRIAIAQASWLSRHGKRSAGRTILTELISRRSNDIYSRLALHNFLDSPIDRYQNMHALLRLGSGGPTRMLAFGHDIAASEILTMPESSVFFPFIRESAASGPTEAVRKVYSDFLPQSAPVSEDFDATRLSENWDARGTTLAAIAGSYNLQAASDMAEAYLRLRKSELIRDGFIEVHVGESVGAFWLYARRSSQTMIRFGFEDDGYIRIQSWKNGEIRTSDSVSWIRPANDFVMRLEVRGDGALGYIDGRPAFNAPLMIPVDIAYGWWSIAPYSPELGNARARIGRISAGPLSPSIVLLRETDAEKIADALDSLRDNIHSVSALAPVLFEQTPDGSVPLTPLTDSMPIKMFASYHRLRLMPAISLEYYSDINPEAVVRIIDHHSLSGLVLLVRSMPNDEWFEKMESIIEKTSANLIVIQREAPIFSGKPPKHENNVATIREIQRGSVLLQPNETEWRTAIRNADTWNPKAALNSISPQIVLLGAKAEEDPEPEKPKTPPKPLEAQPQEAPEEPAAPSADEPGATEENEVGKQ